MSWEIMHTGRTAFKNRHLRKNCRGRKKKILLSLKSLILMDAGSVGLQHK